MRFVKISDVEPGMIIAMPVMDINQRVLLNKNKELSTYTIMKLNEYDYKGVFIYDELSKGIEASETIPINVRLHAIQASKEMNIDDCSALSESIIQSVRKNPNIETNLTLLSSFDNNTYNHSVNVAAYSAAIGISMGYDEEQLKNLIVGALLHDVGKSHVPIEIINKKGALTDKERKIINRHPSDGYRMIKDSDISSIIKVAVYEHHENIDGSGYPRGICGDSIHETARIIHVADVYDAMVSKRPYKIPINPADAIEFLYSKCGIMFDTNIVGVFTRKLIPYPKGITVLLSNQESAIVNNTDMMHPLRPDVRIISTGEDISLYEHNEITIVGFDDM